MAARREIGAPERGAPSSTSREMDRPRPGANQTGAGSPATQHGEGEGTSMTQDSTGPLAEGQWTYWVSYSHASGLGAVAVCAQERLATAGQLVGLAGRIGRDAGLRDVVILNWQRLAPAVRPDRPADLRRADGDEAGLAAAGHVGVPVSASPGAAVRGEVTASVHGPADLRRAGAVEAGEVAAGPVGVPVSASPGAGVRAEVAALAHVLGAADRIGVGVTSTNCSVHPPLPSGADLSADVVARRVVELAVHLDGPGWGRGAAEDAARLLAAAGCLDEPVARRYSGSGASRGVFETRTGRLVLPGGVAVQLKVFCEPTDRSAADGAGPVAGGER
jgi:hypothetical protein